LEKARRKRAPAGYQLYGKIDVALPRSPKSTFLLSQINRTGRLPASTYTIGDEGPLRTPPAPPFSITTLRCRRQHAFASLPPHRDACPTYIVAQFLAAVTVRRDIAQVLLCHRLDFGDDEDQSLPSEWVLSRPSPPFWVSRLSSLHRCPYTKPCLSGFSPIGPCSSSASIFYSSIAVNFTPFFTLL